jgi:hypothetical protein
MRRGCENADLCVRVLANSGSRSPFALSRLSSSKTGPPFGPSHSPRSDSHGHIHTHTLTHTNLNAKRYLASAIWMGALIRVQRIPWIRVAGGEMKWEAGQTRKGVHPSGMGWKAKGTWRKITAIKSGMGGTSNLKCACTPSLLCLELHG